jgi:iron complex transport system substrate-binding protein
VRPARARKEKPRVSAFLSAKQEKILELKPDLVVGFSDLQADIARDLTKRGLNVLIFNQRSVQEILDMILALSSLVGAAEKGTRLIQQLEHGLEQIRAGAKAFPRRPRVYFEEWDEPMISGIRWVSELIEIAGGEDVFSAQSHSQAAAGRIISDARLPIGKNPEVILGSWCGKKFRPERVAARPGWQDMAAVKANQLHEIKSADILQPGPAALTDGVRRIHELLRDFVFPVARTRSSGAA